LKSRRMIERKKGKDIENEKEIEAESRRVLN
jgi:hypothetical protein